MSPDLSNTSIITLPSPGLAEGEIVLSEASSADSVGDFIVDLLASVAPALEGISIDRQIITASIPPGTTMIYVQCQAEDIESSQRLRFQLTDATGKCFFSRQLII